MEKVYIVRDLERCLYGVFTSPEKAIEALSKEMGECIRVEEDFDGWYISDEYSDTYIITEWILNRL